MKPSLLCIPASGEQATVGRYSWKKLNGALWGKVHLHVLGHSVSEHFGLNCSSVWLFIVHFVCSHQSGALECSKGAHECCFWLWSWVCYWQSPKNTSLPVRTVSWADLYSVRPGGNDRWWRCPSLRVFPSWEVPKIEYSFLLLPQIFPPTLSISSSIWRRSSFRSHHLSSVVLDSLLHLRTHYLFRVSQSWMQIPAQLLICATQVNWMKT